VRSIGSSNIQRERGEDGDREVPRESLLDLAAGISRQQTLPEPIGHDEHASAGFRIAFERCSFEHSGEAGQLTDQSRDPYRVGAPDRKHAIGGLE
jgi:hypothetical protein